MRENLLRHIKSQKYMFFDYETCNLNLGSKENKPWQLAFCLVHGGKIYKKLNYLLKWDNIKVSKDAANHFPTISHSLVGGDKLFQNL